MTSFANQTDAKAAAQKAANSLGQTVYLIRRGRLWELSVTDPGNGFAVRPNQESTNGNA
jgi:hypothetical protein